MHRSPWDHGYGAIDSQAMAHQGPALCLEGLRWLRVDFGDVDEVIRAGGKGLKELKEVDRQIAVSLGRWWIGGIPSWRAILQKMLFWEYKAEIEIWVKCWRNGLKGGFRIRELYINIGYNLLLALNSAAHPRRPSIVSLSQSPPLPQHPLAPLPRSQRSGLLCLRLQCRILLQSHSRALSERFPKLCMRHYWRRTGIAAIKYSAAECLWTPTEAVG